MKLFSLSIVILLLLSCNKSVIPSEINNRKWIAITEYNSSFYERCPLYLNYRDITVEDGVIRTYVMEDEELEITRVIDTLGGYKIYAKRYNYENRKKNDPSLKLEYEWYIYFRWIGKEKLIAQWDIIAPTGEIDEGFSKITIDENSNYYNVIKSLSPPPCEVCFSKSTCDSIKNKLLPKYYSFFYSQNKKKKVKDLQKQSSSKKDSISKLLLGNYSFQDAEGTNNAVSYFIENKEKQSIFSGIGFQTYYTATCKRIMNKDTLQLFHKETLEGHYLGGNNIPLLEMYSSNNKYYVKDITIFNEDGSFGGWKEIKKE